MKTETKYTPTPWHFEKHKKYAVYETGGPGGSRERVDYEYNLIVREDGNDPYLRTPIAEVTISTEADANASFIVTACNSHDELVAFIQELLSECETVAKTDHLCLDHNTFATKARAALKKAGAL